jgi:cytoskeletal protein RodZ
MMPIGQQLRRAREARSISLEQAAQVTHIRLRYLQALEADDLTALPSAVQARGFLRVYAAYLKLDPASLLAEQDGAAPQGDASPPESPRQRPAGPPPDTSQADAILAEVGHRLRTQRELLGLSIENVERQTRIRAHYLRALEAGELSGLPSPVQGRGMLNNYAHFLGLDQDQVLLRYADGLQAHLAARQAARTVEVKTVPRRPASPPSRFSRLFSLDILLSALLVVFFIAFIGWGLMRISQVRAGQAPTQTAPSISDILLSTPTLETSLTPATPLPSATAEFPAGGGPAVDTTSIPAETELVLTEVVSPTAALPDLSGSPLQVTVIARQRAWLLVSVDGEVVFQGRILPGAAYPFAGEERIELLTGNGAAVQVIYNREDLGVLGAFGEVIERIFTLTGVQTPTASPTPLGVPPPTDTPTPFAQPGEGQSASPTPTP